MVVHLSASDIKAPSLERAQRVISTPPLRAPSHVAIGGCIRVFNVSLALSNSAVGGLYCCGRDRSSAWWRIGASHHPRPGQAARATTLVVAFCVEFSFMLLSSLALLAIVPVSSFFVVTPADAAS